MQRGQEQKTALSSEQSWTRLQEKSYIKRCSFFGEPVLLLLQYLSEFVCFFVKGYKVCLYGVSLGLRTFISKYILNFLDNDFYENNESESFLRNMSGEIASIK